MNPTRSVKKKISFFFIKKIYMQPTFFLTQILDKIIIYKIIYKLN